MAGDQAALTFFDRMAPRYDRLLAPSRAATEADLAQTCGTWHGAHVLDLACGTGRTFPWLLAQGHTVTGLDGSEGMLAAARKRRSAAQVRLLCADMYQPLPLASGSVDAILALHSALAHPPAAAPCAALRALGCEMQRVLRPAHDRSPLRLVIDVPDPAWAQAALRTVGGHWYEATLPGAPPVRLFAPPPASVAEALGLPLRVVEGPLGPRLVGR